jgi:glycosyltransferase involved in cell wall biosynthesis
MMSQAVDVIDVADWGAEGLLPALSKRAALVVTAMGATDHPAASPTLAQRVQYGLLGCGAGWSVRLADRVIAISEDSRRAVLERFRADPRKVTKVSLGIDLNTFRRVSASTDKVLQGLPRGRIVSYVGLITHRHGVVSLCRAAVKAMQAVPELYLIIVGGDASTAPGGRSMKAFLQDIASSEGFADRFVFIDSLSLPNLIQLYSASDVFVYPQLAGTFGLPVIEAMACGVPVVTTRVAVGRELEEYGLAGLAVVPVEDAGEIAASIVRFLGLSRETRQLIGQENRNLLESRFSISSWVHNVGTVYADAVRERNSHLRN